MQKLIGIAGVAEMETPSGKQKITTVNVDIMVVYCGRNKKIALGLVI